MALAAAEMALAKTSGARPGNKPGSDDSSDPAAAQKM